MKRYGLLIGVLLLAFLAASRAEPPQSPDVVTIDGAPCNRFCQFYMARSRGLSMRKLADDRLKGPEALASPANQDRLAKVAAARNEMPQTRTAAAVAPQHWPTAGPARPPKPGALRPATNKHKALNKTVLPARRLKGL